jgi:hypothetical protein
VLVVSIASDLRYQIKGGERRTRGPFQSCVQEIRPSRSFFREMWDTAGLPSAFLGLQFSPYRSIRVSLVNMSRRHSSTATIETTKRPSLKGAGNWGSDLALYAEPRG